MVKLSQHFIDALANEPETGMGYQVGDVTLDDGRVYKRAVIVNGSEIGEVEGSKKIPFNSDQIKMIELTHEKW